MQELLTEQLIKGVWAVAKIYLKNNKCKLVTPKDDFEEAVRSQMQLLKNWSTKISAPDLPKAKYTNKSYVPLDFFFYPTRQRVSKNELIHTIPLKNLLSEDINHAIIMGFPGAGKTTLLKYICNLLFFKENAIFPNLNMPILIRLRDIRWAQSKPMGQDQEGSYQMGPIFDYLFNIFGLKVLYPPEMSTDSNMGSLKHLHESLLLKLIDNFRALIMLDGFDEISLKNTKHEAIKDIKRMVLYLERSSVIITSRTGDLNYRIDNAHRYEICPLSESQINSFAKKWLPKNRNHENFLESVRKSPYGDAAIRPLTIAHLCAIYEKSGKIPNKPKSIYKKIVRLLLEVWDEEKPLERNSKYSHFDVEQKFDFLCNLAYVLTVKVRLTTFSSDNLETAYGLICNDFDLPERQASKVANELETHTGLFIKSSSDSFEFAHKSLQEYLTAEYLVKLPSIPTNHYELYWLANELAIAVAISSRPSDYFVELINSRLSSLSQQAGRGNIKLDLNYIRNFIGRMLAEKPDFNKSSKVGMSLLKLYSIYTEFSLKEGAQRLLFHDDILYGQFEKMVSLILKRNKLSTVLGQYDKVDQYQAIDGSKIYQLKRKSAAYKYLPSSLHCRSSFYS